MDRKKAGDQERRIWNQLLHENPSLQSYRQSRELPMLREQHGLKVKDIVPMINSSQAGTSRLLQAAESHLRSFLWR